MARACTVCGSPDRAQIDVELAAGQSIRAMAERLDVSAAALQRHKRHHLTPALVRVARERRTAELAESSFDSTEAKIEDLMTTADRLLAKAEDRSALVAAAQLLREARQLVETRARLRGELDDRAPVHVVNVLASPEFLALSQGFRRALAVLPEGVRFEFVAAVEANVPELVPAS